MASPLLNGSGKRKLASWIDGFIAHTDNLHAPVIFRRWAAITAIASVVEQKVWLTTSSQMYPNLYTILVGHPGVGKTRTIRAACEYLAEIPEFHLAPTSMTAASMTDALLDAKRIIIRLPDEPLEYNTMLIAADEFSAFIHKYENEMVGLLSAFYDPTPYGQHRRGKEIKIKIKRPQLNLLCGSTPANLLQFMPEGAWDQGFTSRLLLIFSDERIIGDDFATTIRGLNPDLVHDLKLINSLSDDYRATEDYRNAVNNWRQLGEPPVPNHPKLIHYATRRRAHLYKLSMIAAIDRSNTMLLTKDDFNRAMGWLLEAEEQMPEIFKAGVTGIDGKVMDELWHFAMAATALGKTTPESKLVNEARKAVPAHSVMRVLEVMERSGMILAVSADPRSGQRNYAALPRE